jgi:hypothetical protein
MLDLASGAKLEKPGIELRVLCNILSVKADPLKEP